MKVFVIEDDRHIRNGLVEILEAEGYETASAGDGSEALARYDDEAPDFVLLDIMMPGTGGYDVCKEIRRRDDRVPIIFISAKGEEVDRVVGLELGADDFIVKPFGVSEVIARIRAVTRRCLRFQRADDDGRFTVGDLQVLPQELRAIRGDETIDLSLRDVGILRLLHDNRGKVVDRDLFFQECWGYGHAPNSRTLDQHVSKLRRRVERDPKNPEIIRTVHGVGYRFE